MRSAYETLRILKKSLKDREKIKAVNLLIVGLLEKIYLDRFDEIESIKALSIYESQKHLIATSTKIIGIQNKIVEKYMDLNLVHRALTVLEDMRKHLPKT